MNSLNQHLFLLLNADAQTSAFSIWAGRTLAEWPVPIALLLVGSTPKTGASPSTGSFSD